ncbi:MAG TPA: sialidase family protein [Planctomycetota bacterium]
MNILPLVLVLAASQDVKVDLLLGDPVLISQAPPDVRGWGPWQFPHADRLADGRIHVDYHIDADSAKAYGKPVGHAFSKDDGKTWTLAKEVEGDDGLPLPNGDRLKPYTQESIAAETLALGKPAHVLRGSYPVDWALYPVAKLPPQLRGYRMLRLSKGGGAWTQEFPKVSIPDEHALVTEGVFAFQSFDRGFAHLRVAPDKSLIAATYAMRRVPEGERAKLGEFRWGTVILRSTDHGRSWTTHGEIPFQPDTAADPSWAKRDGFTEPDIAFLPDGSMFCLIRTLDGNGVGPMYSSRSTDQGKTWSKPVVFDSTGVWPVLHSLKNGVTLASYGRPGLYVRAAGDPGAQTWGDRVTVVAPKVFMQDTCSYADWIRLSDESALLLYTDFHWPDAKGVPRKTVLARTVTARKKA